MGRILAIDYGTKRTGIAVTDPLQIISSGLTTVQTNMLLSFLEEYIKKEDVERIVVGFPLQMNNTPSDTLPYIKSLVKKLSVLYPSMPIDYYDERFTSVIAHKAMIEGGMKKKKRQNKAIVDEISATIILQDYMESRIYKEKKL